MRLFPVLVAVVLLVPYAEASCWKITSHGHRSVWAVTTTGQCAAGTCANGTCTTGTCTTGACATGQCATTTTTAAPQPVQTGEVIYSSGSCASGQCGGSSSRGLFRRWR